VRRAVLIATLSLAALLGLGACGKPADPLIEECRSSITSRLKAPSSYKETKVNSFRNPLSYRELRSKFLPKYLTPTSAQAFLTLKGKPLEEASVYIEYDAVNEFNAPLRHMEACYFIFVNGQRYHPASSPVSTEAKALSKSSIDEWERTLGDMPDLDDPNVEDSTECCLPWRETNSAHGNVAGAE
jgi:hypothetical protein